MNGDQSALADKLSAALDAFDWTKDPINGGPWFKLKCVNEGEYMCIGTCIAVPHFVVDDGFKNDEKMKDMQWYNNAIKVLEDVQSVD
jgi:hypothetical protein